MNVTEFKGIAINAKAGRFVVAADGFRPDGYATISHAKGAITKHRQDTGLESRKPSSDITAGIFQAFAKPVSGPTGSYLPRDAATTPVNESDAVLALLRFEGFLHTDGRPKLPDSRSRNKREGRYAGKWHGMHLRHQKARQPSAEAVFMICESTS